MIAGRFVAYEATPTRLLARISPWLFPGIESAHLLGLCALGGTLLVVDLRMLGVGLTSQPLDALARAVHPWLEASLALILSTGILLFMSEAVRVLHTPSFWVKVATLLLAIFYTFTMRRRVAARPGGDTSRLTRVTGAASLLLWLTVAAAGRWIGFSS